MSDRRRSVPSRRTNPRFFIFVEGDSEYRYFNQFRRRDLPLSLMVSRTNHLDGLGIVKDSIRELRKVGYDHKRDHAAVVFDVDQNGEERIREALRLCEKNHVGLYISNPSYEYWICLHFGEVRHISEQKDLEDQMTRNLGRQYRKGEDITRSIDRAMIDKAIARSSRVLGSDREPVDKCLATVPSTMLHILVRDILDYSDGKRPN